MVKAWPGGPLWFCACAEINRDGNLRLQYLAGLALNTSTENRHLLPDSAIPPLPGQPPQRLGAAHAGALLRPGRRQQVVFSTILNAETQVLAIFDGLVSNEQMRLRLQ